MKPSSQPRSWSATWGRPLALGLVPLLLLLCGVRSLPPEHAGHSAGQRPLYEVPKFRAVVLILDSVGTPMAFDPTLMPFVSSLMSTSLFGQAFSCPGKATFPCVKSIFEGRTATTGTTLQDFSAVASNRTTWPASLAALGHRLVLTSDHTINRLYPDAFVDAMNYETLHVPLLERDGYAYARARKWLDDPTVDVLLLHIIGTDKVAHEYPVRGPEYRAKYLEVDEFVREVAGRLSPNDYLYVIGDHGHNELGGHTEDAAYIARGPLFPQGRNANLGAADMLFLLSVPYALSLPEEYEGHVRTDLTLLPEAARQKWLQEQARLWQIPAEGMASDALEGRLNQHVIQNREEGQRKLGLDTLRRVGPWLLAAALFLLSELKSPKRNGGNRFSQVEIGIATLFVLGILMGLAAFSFGAWFVVLAALWRCVHQLGGARAAGALCILAALAVTAFWITPSGLAWFHIGKNQPIAWTAFYPVALAAGLAVTLTLGAPSWRAHAVRVLWVVGVAIWLLAYFGPYNYALTGRGAKVVLCILVPLAIILAGGWRTFLFPGTLCFAGLFPFITFHTSSFNIEYRLTDRIAEQPAALGVALCILVGILVMVALRFNGSRRLVPGRMPAWTGRIACLIGWMLAGTMLFEVDLGKLLGVLLGSLWLVGCLALFRRAKLPSSWSALAGVILLFAVFHFVLNGFALSHVDFRFASNKIIPFQEEALRAPQLIVWVMMKYLFILLPPFAVLLPGLERKSAMQILRLGCWRELMIVLSAVGLSLFDKRGLDELCSEEIYFWTFFNLALWLLCLAVIWMKRNEPEDFGQLERLSQRLATEPVLEDAKRS